MLECVVNVSSADPVVVGALARSAAACLLDLHSDRYHNRSVLTLAGPGLDESLHALAARCLELVDLSHHVGVHPRLGALDVVPFAPIAAPGHEDLHEAVAARDAFARYAAEVLGLPCFLYGPERSLPEIRRHAFSSLAPDLGPRRPHPSAGACCVGARGALVAFNLVLEHATLDEARAIAASVRAEEIRALGLPIGDEVQLSCNLVRPFRVGPAALYDRVAALTAVRRCELVGLVPDAVFTAVEPSRRARLDLEEGRTIGARLAAIGIEPPRERP